MSGQNMIDNNIDRASQSPNTGGDRAKPARDPDELTDQELEWVVGGTDPEFARTQFEQLQKPPDPPASTS